MPTPLKAVRSHCLWCCNGSSNEVSLCTARACPLWPYRFGHRPDAAELVELATDPTPVYPSERPATRADLVADGATGLAMIRRRCIDCSGASAIAVKACRATDCALHPFRLG